MKGEIELSGLGTADVQAITPKQIGDYIDTIARGKAVFAQLFRENRDLTKIQGRKITLPRISAGATISSDLAPGDTVAPGTFSWTGLTIEVSKFGARLEIPREVIETPVRDVFKDILLDTGEEWAKVLDDRARTIALDLKEGTITSWSGGTLGTTTLTPIIQITSVSGATISQVDYYGGSIWLRDSVSAATVTFLYSDRCRSTGLYVSAVSPGMLLAHDILNIRRKLIESSMDPDVVLVNDKDLPTLLYDANASGIYTDITEYKDEALNGEVGRIADLRLLTSVYTPEGVAIVVDSSKLGWDVIKRDLHGIKEDKPEYDSVYFHLWAEREFGVSNSLAIGVVVNANSGEYPAYGKIPMAIFNSVPLAASSTIESNRIFVGNCLDMALQIQNSTSSSVDVEVFGSVDGEVFDTSPYVSFNVGVETITRPVTPGPKYIKVKATNPTTVDTTISVRLYGRRDREWTF